MLALGGTIGTGLFVGSGSALATGGPVGCLYVIIIERASSGWQRSALPRWSPSFPPSSSLSRHSFREWQAWIHDHGTGRLLVRTSLTLRARSRSMLTYSRLFLRQDDGELELRPSGPLPGTPRGD